MTERLSDEQVAALTRAWNEDTEVVYAHGREDYVNAALVTALALEVQQARKVLAFLREIVTIRAGHSRTAAIVLDVLDHQARVK